MRKKKHTNLQDCEYGAQELRRIQEFVKGTQASKSKIKGYKGSEEGLRTIGSKSETKGSQAPEERPKIKPSFRWETKGNQASVETSKGMRTKDHKDSKVRPRTAGLSERDQGSRSLRSDTKGHHASAIRPRGVRVQELHQTTQRFRINTKDYKALGVEE